MIRRRLRCFPEITAALAKIELGLCRRLDLFLRDLSLFFVRVTHRGIILRRKLTLVAALYSVDLLYSLFEHLDRRRWRDHDMLLPDDLVGGRLLQHTLFCLLRIENRKPGRNLRTQSGIVRSEASEYLQDVVEFFVLAQVAMTERVFTLCAPG